MVDVQVPVYPSLQVVGVQVDGHVLSCIEYVSVLIGPRVMIEYDYRFSLGNLRQVVQQPVINIFFGIPRPVIASPHGGDDVMHVAHVE